MKESFIKYTKAGFSCLPTKPNKAPAVSTWGKEPITDVKLFDKAKGIGIICGKLSDNLECLDFDNHFGDAKENLGAFLQGEVKKIYKRYKLPIQATLTGGFHLLYRCDKIGGNQKLASRPKKNSLDRWVPDAIIETRGEGGYFVASPTSGYKVIRNDLLNIQCITEEEREILLSTAKSFNTWHELKKNDFEEGEKPGDVFNSKYEAIDEMKASLKRSGWNEVEEGKWQRPDKKIGISATLGKVADNVFYNFSANGYPFEEKKAYTPFQVITLMDYAGDFSKFAKELSERYNLNGKKAIDKPKPEVKTESQYDKIISDAMIDLEVEVQKPPVIMRIRQNIFRNSSPEIYDNRLFTLGNFSAITGKGKSKKTFLTTLFLASATSNGIIQNKIISDLPEQKTYTMLFDTEQSRYDAYVASKRIPSLIGYMPENFGSFDLREYSPIERCNIIEYALKKLKGNVGYIVIDGIADLATAINDEVEATRVVSLLMKWTKIYNCHITTVIHQNKNDEYATGHLGSSILKKAECIISVKKDPNEYSISHVKCDLIRGTSDFEDFSFSIDENGLPAIDKSNSYTVKNNEF